MTNATMAFAELAEKGADIDVLRQMESMSMRAAAPATTRRLPSG